MSRRMIRRRLDQLELRAWQVRALGVAADRDLPDYESMSDEELKRTYAESVAAYEASPEAQAHAAWQATLTDDQLVQAFRDGIDESHLKAAPSARG